MANCVEKSEEKRIERKWSSWLVWKKNDKQKEVKNEVKINEKSLKMSLRQWIPYANSETRKNEAKKKG